MKRNNPTVLFFVAERYGVPVAFAPVYLAAHLAHLGFNPESPSEVRRRALNVLTDGVMAFMVQFGIREIQTLTKPAYRLAKWAEDHHFEMDERQLYKIDLNKILAEA